LHVTKISKQQKGHSFEQPFLKVDEDLLSDELDAAVFGVQKVDPAVKTTKVNVVSLAFQNDLTSGVHNLISLVYSKPIDYKNA
jgi:hypothetical protein